MSGTAGFNPYGTGRHLDKKLRDCCPPLTCPI
jgi:hypothetical protein